MTPIIPTHRPLLTPERTAIAIAVGAVLCSVFLVAEVAYGSSAEPAAARAVVSCDAPPLVEPGDGKPVHF